MLILKLVMRNCIQVLCLVLVLAPYKQTLAEKENQIYRILKRSQTMDPGEILVFYITTFYTNIFYFSWMEIMEKMPFYPLTMTIPTNLFPKETLKWKHPIWGLDHKTGFLCFLCFLCWSKNQTKHFVMKEINQNYK